MTVTTARSGRDERSGPDAPRITPEQMLALDRDGNLRELLDGRLVERRISDFAHLIASHVNDQLVLWESLLNSGCTFVHSTFQCFPLKSEQVRRPDVAYVSAARLSGYEWRHGHIRIAPDLVVEIVSPNDEVYELDRKIGEYF